MKIMSSLIQKLLERDETLEDLTEEDLLTEEELNLFTELGLFPL
jgi:hypothetical protein